MRHAAHADDITEWRKINKATMGENVERKRNKKRVRNNNGKKKKKKANKWKKAKGIEKKNGVEKENLKSQQKIKICGKGEEEEESGGGHCGSVIVKELIERVITSEAFQIGYSVR